MHPSTSWYSFEMLSGHYGTPYSGEESSQRALDKLSSSFGGYDAARNNCQHFAVWARYGVKSMLLSDEAKTTMARQLGAMAGMLLLPPPFNLASGCFGAFNIVSAKTGSQMSSRIEFY